MKHLLCTLLLTLTVCLCSAQTEHMKFKGIPMEGTLQSFTLKLKAKGYVPLGTEDGVSVLKGEFAGYKNCHIYAVADKSGMICRVCVEFPKNVWKNFKTSMSKTTTSAYTKLSLTAANTTAPLPARTEI